MLTDAQINPTPSWMEKLRRAFPAAARMIDGHTECLREHREWNQRQSARIRTLEVDLEATKTELDDLKSRLIAAESYIADMPSASEAEPF